MPSCTIIALSAIGPVLNMGKRIKLCQHSFLFQSQEMSFHKKKTFYTFSSRGFFITLYLPGMPVVNNLFIGLIFIFSFAYNTLTDKIRLLKQRPAIISIPLVIPSG